MLDSQTSLVLPKSEDDYPIDRKSPYIVTMHLNPPHSLSSRINSPFPPKILHTLISDDSHGDKTRIYNTPRVFKDRKAKKSCDLYYFPLEVKHCSSTQLQLEAPSEKYSTQTKLWESKMQGKIVEPRDDLICGLPCKFDDDDKIRRRRNLGVSQLSSRNNVGGNSNSERNTQQERCSEINEASVLLHSLNAFTGLNFDEYPVFTKLMRKAHVEAGFLLGMPATFCRTHLLKEDTMMMLETDEGEQYEAKYLPRHGALSGGWKRFALDKKLQQGDLVVFQLVEPTRFKLYISRKNSSTEELPTAIPNLHTKETESDEDDKPLITYMRKEPCQSELKSIKKTGNEVGIHFSNITGFEDFNDITTELLQNHDVSEFTLNAYYKLCRSQNAFLHADLLKGFNTRKFNGAIRRTISKTVEIASTLRTCTLSSVLGDFSQWNKTLNYCEGLGLDVNFLRSHLYQLRDLTVDSDGPIIKACRERPRSECQAKKLEIIIAELRKISDVLAAEAKTLESTAGWEKYFEACSWHIQVEDDIREIEGLLAEFGKFFEH